MTRSLDRMVDQAYRGRSAADILDASPDALLGVSGADAVRLRDAFGITTVRGMAQSVYFSRAQVVLAATGNPAFDAGPPLDWEDFFGNAPLDHFIQHPARRFRLDFGPVYYRGRLDGTARVILVGQDPATNEILAHRIFVGRSGQRIQGFLKKLGLTRSYVLMNTFLYSVFGQFNSELRAISLEQPILSHRNEFLDRLAGENPVQAVVTIGNAARHAAENWPGSQPALAFHITHPSARDEEVLLASWNDALDSLRPIVDPDDDGQPDPTPYGTRFKPSDTVPIPRHDLPFGMPDWHGDGPHGRRDGNKKIIWTAP